MVKVIFVITLFYVFLPTFLVNKDDHIIDESISQREICRVQLYDTSIANSSQLQARSKSTLLSRI